MDAIFKWKKMNFFTYVREWNFFNVNDWLGYKCKYEWVFHMWGIWIRMGQPVNMHEWEKTADVWEQMKEWVRCYKCKWM